MLVTGKKKKWCRDKSHLQSPIPFLIFGFLHWKVARRCINAWKQLDNSRRKHNKDTNQEFVKEAWEGLEEKRRKGARLYSKNGNVFYQPNLLIRSLTMSCLSRCNSRIQTFLHLWALAKGGCYHFPKKYVFLRFNWIIPKVYPGALLPSLAPLLLLKHFIRFYVLPPPTKVGFLSMKGLGLEKNKTKTFLRLLCVSLSQTWTQEN